MNTLEEAQTYFQSKGYDTKICVFKPEQLTRVKSQLIIQGQKMPRIPNTNEDYYRMRVAICSVEGQWEVQRLYLFQSPIKVNALREAVTLADTILGSPVSERIWGNSMNTIEQAQAYLEAQGYSTEFLSPVHGNERLLIYGRKALDISNPNHFEYKSIAALIKVNEKWSAIDSPFNHAPPTHEILDVVVVFIEDMVGPPFEEEPNP